jgi:acetoin utilization deacetylase AcuC-like enzyme
MGMSSGDFTDLTNRALAFAPAGRRIAFLEGGDDLDARAAATAACVAALGGAELRPEPVTSGGPGRDVVDAALMLRERTADT